MGDMLNATNGPGAVSYGLFLCLVTAGLMSFLNQLDGPGEVTGYNVVLALFIGVLYGTLQFRHRRGFYERLQERGKVGPKTTMEDLPWVRPPHSVKEAFWAVIGLTLALRGIFALLASYGPWPQLVAEWNTWLAPFVIALFVGLGSFVVGKRHRASESPEP